MIKDQQPNSQWPTINDNNQSPATTNQRATTNQQQPATNGQRERQPATANEQSPTTNHKQPTSFSPFTAQTRQHNPVLSPYLCQEQRKPLFSSKSSGKAGWVGERPGGGGAPAGYWPAALPLIPPRSQRVDAQHRGILTEQQKRPRFRVVLGPRTLST